MTWWMPVAVAWALSVRTPNEGNLIDYEMSTRCKWNIITIEALFERENGDHYYGYRFKGDRSLSDDWLFEFDSHIKTASNVDRQSVIVGRKWKYIGVGGGAVAEKYRDPKGAMNLWI
ncbi:MAG: hypothetical protein P9M15_03925, partial [Candidatus Electryoneaceae bacterium]|nr:hypothetical protein [Candidatus Electryoneaceae bacterium]